VAAHNEKFTIKSFSKRGGNEPAIWNHSEDDGFSNFNPTQPRRTDQMFGKLLVSASFAALLIAVPAAAQDQGQGGQNKPILMKPQGQGQGQDAGQATGAQRQSDQTQGAGNQGQMKKRVQNPQGATGEQPASEAQATGQENQTGNKKRMRQNTQTEQGAPANKQNNQNAEQTGQGGTAKKRNNQNAQENGQNNDQMTTGATGRAERDIPVEKRTVIRERIITRKVPRVERDRIDFDINVGVAIPGTIALQPLPPDIIEIVPAYRGYDYFVLADGTIIIVDPGTHEIVYVLAA
jgi:hypothetical protein